MKQMFLLRGSLGLVYLGFGAIKLWPGSPAEQLVVRTISAITLGLLNSTHAMMFVAIGEVMIGAGLIVCARGFWLRVFAGMVVGHLLGTTTTLWYCPDLLFQGWHPTLAGQYCMKNLVFLSCALVLFIGDDYSSSKSAEKASKQ